MTKDKNTVSTIKEVIKRIDCFINPVTTDNLKAFFLGFKIGNISQRDNLELSDYTDAWIEAVRFRGWKVNSLGIENELKEKGMSETETVQELFEIEIATWRILEEKNRETSE